MVEKIFETPSKYDLTRKGIPFEESLAEKLERIKNNKLGIIIQQLDEPSTLPDKCGMRTAIGTWYK